jgi:hypothetical protein
MTSGYFKLNIPEQTVFDVFCKKTQEKKTIMFENTIEIEKEDRKRTHATNSRT